jgi:hypothetical protein
MSLIQSCTRPEVFVISYCCFDLLSFDEFFLRRKLRLAFFESLDGSTLNFFSKIIRQMKAGINNNYDITEASGLVQVWYHLMRF